MAKRRTGLQSQISSIFSGVPIPKKGASGEGTPNAPSQAAGPERTTPKAPPAPSSAPPKYQPPIEPVREIPPAKAAPRIPETKIGEIPTVPRRKKERTAVPRAGASPVRQKVAIAMIVVLSVLLVFLLTRSSQKPSYNPVTPGATEQAKNVAAFSKANVKIDWPIPQKYPENLRDPMILGVQKTIRVERTSALVVKGITYSDDRKYAVIGTETFEEGDTVQGATVIKINPNSVEFEKDGKKWTQEVQGR